jgi:3-oxoacyl-[acyl-carrier protein] reductase
MDLGIKGKRAFVMGSSGGLGFAIAQALSREGARVAICARTEPALRQAAEKIPGSLAFTGDVSRSGETARMIESVNQQWGGVDILVTNSGGPPKGGFAEITPTQWQESFQNLWMSTVEGIQTVLPLMKKEKWGRILMVTSVAAKEPMDGLTISNGLRAGLLGLARSLSNEVAAEGITINVLLPGYTRTERLKSLGVNEEKISSVIPARRLGEPEEFAELAAFLASKSASYITGQAVACDGGYLKGL